MDVEITSVSKKKETLHDAAAAVFVISGDDVRRLGIREIPEALRIVPGLHVARVNGTSWAVSARGSNTLFANKLLVLIDGRSVYTPLFSGTFWDVQNPMIEDIDRIEVIRGPGASLWGANAVNGVINIITKSSEDTTGGVVVGGGGTIHQGYSDVRYGAKIGDSAYGRVYGSFLNRARLETVGPFEGNDGSDLGQTGFRVDSNRDSTALTLQGDYYAGSIGSGFVTAEPEDYLIRYRKYRTELAGGNVLGRWTESFKDSSKFTLQAYWDYTYRNDDLASFTYNIFDVDSQYRLAPIDSHELVVGAGIRTIHDQLGRGRPATYTDYERTLAVASWFIQDEWSFADKAKLIAGSKFEHNPFTGFQVQPNVRVQWQPWEAVSLWASFSRANRTPSRAESAVRIPATYGPPGTIPGSDLPGVVFGVGNTGLSIETLDAYEVGLRTNISSSLSFDLSAYVNDYSDLVAGQPSQPQLIRGERGAIVAVYNRWVNGADRVSMGVEPLLTWQATDWLRLQGWYTFLKQYQDLSAGNVAFSATTADPRNLASLRVIADLSQAVQLDLQGRYVDSVPYYNIDSYIDLNARVGYKLCKGLELSLAGFNLLNNNHLEYATTFSYPLTPRAQIPRGVMGQLRWEF
jgi:iron complex outermembrane receptor protein